MDIFERKNMWMQGFSARLGKDALTTGGGVATGKM